MKIGNHIFFIFLGFLACLVAGSAAREAIVGGNIAEIDQFPYQVSLQIDNHHKCGGGVIGDEYVLTAAQCIVDNLDRLHNRLTIVARTNNLYDHDSGSVRLIVEKAFVSIKYNRSDPIPSGDIAILKTKQPIPVTIHGSLQKSRLLRYKNEDRYYRTGRIAGFGWTWTHGRGIARTGNNTDGRLRFAHADIVECVGETINEEHLCAKLQQHPLSGPAGTCRGDTGDLLIVNEKSVIGILSVGPESCVENVNYAIYTRVTNYMSFIRKAKENKKTKNMHEYILTS